jgi:predicted RNA-binding protein
LTDSVHMTIINIEHMLFTVNSNEPELAEVCFMCESNVYLRDENGDKLVMEDAAELKNRDGKIWIVDLLGEEKEIEGTIDEITFIDHKIVISPKK